MNLSSQIATFVAFPAYAGESGALAPLSRPKPVYLYTFTPCQVGKSVCAYSAQSSINGRNWSANWMSYCPFLDGHNVAPICLRLLATLGVDQMSKTPFEVKYMALGHFARAGGVGGTR